MMTVGFQGSINNAARNTLITANQPKSSLLVKTAGPQGRKSLKIKFIKQAWLSGISRDGATELDDHEPQVLPPRNLSGFDFGHFCPFRTGSHPTLSDIIRH